MERGLGNFLAPFGAVEERGNSFLCDYKERLPRNEATEYGVVVLPIKVGWVYFTLCTFLWGLCEFWVGVLAYLVYGYQIHLVGDADPPVPPVTGEDRVWAFPDSAGLPVE